MSFQQVVLKQHCCMRVTSVSLTHLVMIGRNNKTNLYNNAFRQRQRQRERVHLRYAGCDPIDARCKPNKPAVGPQLSCLVLSCLLYPATSNYATLHGTAVPPPGPKQLLQKLGPPQKLQVGLSRACTVFVFGLHITGGAIARFAQKRSQENREQARVLRAGLMEHSEQRCSSKNPRTLWCR